MSTLTFKKMTFSSADFDKESSLPPFSVRLDVDLPKTSCETEEDDGLFLGYGEVKSPFPYREQNLYDRTLKDTEYDTVELENENLRALFIPKLGGKLWSLVDKKTGRELLFKNDVIRTCNFAVRNAWTSGGIEWNMGFRGHGAYTCSLINTATTKLDDGTPVLRFYFFERMRACITQMDFFLPDGSELLYVRTRLTNPNTETVPMYWWSNIAVAQEEGTRAITPADYAYIHYKGKVKKVRIPEFNGMEVSYPLNTPYSFDYFFKPTEESLKYICCIDSEGYGLANVSTDKLKARKLFVWGDSDGGRKWMNFLTSDDKSGSYTEIQCGIANTQLECLPMPPRTVWEWVEGYGAIDTDKSKSHGDWTTARAEVEKHLAKKTDKAALEKLLADTRAMAKSPAEVVYKNEGFAGLELLRREKAGELGMMCDHLEFAEIDDVQAAWVSLLENGTVGKHDPDEIPASYQIQTEWTDLLMAAIKDKDSENWYAYYLLGTAELAQLDHQNAREHLLKSVSLCDSAWANYALLILAMREGESDLEAEYALKANALRPDDLSLAKEVLKALYRTNRPDESIKIYESASDEIRENNRCKIYYAYALMRKGEVDRAEELLLCGGKGIKIADLREAEKILTDLWYEIQEKRGISAEEMGNPPSEIDYRMQAKLEKNK